MYVTCERCGITYIKTDIPHYCLLDEAKRISKQIFYEREKNNIRNKKVFDKEENHGLDV